MSEYMGNDPIQNIRIQSKPNEKAGHQVYVTDADTGENIDNIKRLVVMIEPRNINQAIVTYYKFDDQGKIMTDERCKPIQETEILDDPEINTTALVLPDEKLGKVLALWDLAKELGERGRPATYHCSFCASERDDLGYYIHNSNCIIMRAARLTREET